MWCCLPIVYNAITQIIIIINLLSWRIFPTSGGWPVLSPLSSSNPPYPLHSVALLPSFSCLSLPHQSIISLACLSFSILLFLTQTLSLSPSPHLFLQYVQTTSIFSASNAPLDRPLPLTMQSLYSQPYPSTSLRRSF